MTGSAAPPAPARRSVALRALVVVLLVLWALPAIGVLVTAVRPGTDAATSGWWTVVSGPAVTLDNLRTVLGDGAAPVGMWAATLNTFAIAVPATALTIGLGALAAHALAGAPARRRSAWTAVLVGLAIAPVQLSLIPLVSAFADGVRIGGVTLIPDLGLLGSWVGLWVAHTAFGLPVVVLLLTWAVRGVPAELVESARTEGAGAVATLVRVVLPLIAPAVLGVATLQFLWVWNDFLLAATLLGDAVHRSPAAVALAHLVASRGQDLQLVSAGVVITAAVPVVVFLAMQRVLATTLGLRPVPR